MQQAQSEGASITSSTSNTPSTNNNNQFSGSQQTVAIDQPSMTNEDDSSPLQQQLAKAGRRNALTPEAHNIAPIKQTEVVEKLNSMSLLTSSDGCSSNSDTS